MAIPATDKITATFGKKYISAFTSGHMFEAALKTIDAGLQSGKIYNQEFQDAKRWVANGCEHAQHVSADGARDGQRGYGDCRDDIGYAFQMNQAAKLSRNLKKLGLKISLSRAISEYILTLDQITDMWNWLQSVKSIIVKGRKPNVETKTPEMLEAERTNTGHCAICGRRQKLSHDGDLRTRTMVHHGYQMSDYNHSGYRMGKCFGAFRLPYEVSCKANEEFKVVLQDELKTLKAALKALNASTMDMLDVTEYPTGRLREPVEVPYARGTEKYEKERVSRISETESRIRSTKHEIEYQTAKITAWVAAKLYDEMTPAEKARVLD